MDILAHGLWGGAGFYPQGTKRFGQAFLVGIAPDLVSFGLFHLSRPEWIKMRLAGEISGPPPLAMIPYYVFHAYNLSHSLIIWAGVFGLIWFLARKPPWVLLAWGLHVVSDIPTHDSGYFPTPYLWPLPTPLVEGISWSQPWFMASNYTALLAVYLGIFFCVRSKDSARREISKKRRPGR